MITPQEKAVKGGIDCFFPILRDMNDGGVKVPGIAT